MIVVLWVAGSESIDKRNIHTGSAHAAGCTFQSLNKYLLSTYEEPDAPPGIHQWTKQIETPVLIIHRENSCWFFQIIILNVSLGTKVIFAILQNLRNIKMFRKYKKNPTENDNYHAAITHDYSLVYYLTHKHIRILSKLESHYVFSFIFYFFFFFFFHLECIANCLGPYLGCL